MAAFASNVCSIPECELPCFGEVDGVVDMYCSRTHANEALARAKWASLRPSSRSSRGDSSGSGASSRIPLLIPPIKQYKTIGEHNWSRRIESMRKDVECLYGRVKNLCRLFKGGINFNSREKIDNAWFTACILHNRLHKFNRLDEMEEDADWVGSAGAVDDNTEGVGGAVEQEVGTPGFHAFRAQLITHFTVAWAKKEVMWLKRAELV